MEQHIAPTQNENKKENIYIRAVELNISQSPPKRSASVRGCGGCIKSAPNQYKWPSHSAATVETSEPNKNKAKNSQHCQRSPPPQSLGRQKQITSPQLCRQTAAEFIGKNNKNKTWADIIRLKLQSLLFYWQFHCEPT